VTRRHRGDSRPAARPTAGHWPAPCPGRGGRSPDRLGVHPRLVPSRTADRRRSHACAGCSVGWPPCRRTPRKPRASAPPTIASAHAAEGPEFGVIESPVMDARIVAVDVGSIAPPSSFAWAALDAPEKDIVAQGSDPDTAASALLNGLRAERRATLAGVAAGGSGLNCGGGWLAVAGISGVWHAPTREALTNTISVGAVAAPGQAWARPART
jgi:hypothetical protein